MQNECPLSLFGMDLARRNEQLLFPRGCVEVIGACSVSYTTGKHLPWPSSYSSAIRGVGCMVDENETLG